MNIIKGMTMNPNQAGKSRKRTIRARVAAAFRKVTRVVDEQAAHRKTQEFYRSSGAAWTDCLT